MPAYLVAQIRIRDAQLYKQYAARSPALIARFGGRILARGPVTELLEGPASEARIVIIEFPSIEAARSFHGSTDYQEIRKIREAAAEAHVLIVAGVQ